MTGNENLLTVVTLYKRFFIKNLDAIEGVKFEECIKLYRSLNCDEFHKLEREVTSLIGFLKLVELLRFLLNHHFIES